MLSVLMLKASASFLFLVLYGAQWFYIRTIEAKIGFLFFFGLYFIGGVLVSLIIEDVDYFLPHSGLYQVEGGLFTWIVYFTLVYLLPYIFVWIIEFVLRRRGEGEGRRFSFINLRWLFCFVFAYLLFFYINVDLDKALDFSEVGYSNQIESRYSIDYSPLFKFFFLVGGFLICYILSYSIMVGRKNFSKWILFLVAISSYFLVVERIFFSKLYLIGLLVSVLLTFINVYKGHRFKLMLVPLIGFFAFLAYYSFSVYGGFYNVVSPVIKAITRYTLPIYYYVDYYLKNSFEGGFYFSGLLTGQVQNYTQKVYDHAYLVSDTELAGSLSSGVIVHNFVNIGLFGLFLSCLELALLLYAYKVCKVRGLDAVNLSVFSFLLFSVMNFSFASLLANPSAGLGLIFLILFAFKFLRKLKL